MPAEPAVATCVTGLLRSALHPAVSASYATHVVAPVERAGYRVDTHMHVVGSWEHANTTLLEWLQSPPDRESAPWLGHTAVFTSYFVSTVDPMRGDSSRNRGARMSRDCWDYIKRWHGSVSRQGLRAVVMHDGLSDAFSNAHSTASVRFQRVARNRLLSTNDDRFPAYLHFMEQALFLRAAHLAKSATEGGREVVGGGDGCGDGARDADRRGDIVDGRRVARRGACEHRSSHQVSTGSEQKAQKGREFELSRVMHTFREAKDKCSKW